ncbi:MAG: DNA methyltransferase [Nitrospirota bacterium]
MITKTTIIIGDSRRMEELKDELVHLVITSPPYWQLKDYGNGSQIGFNDSYEDYINNLNLVWKECYRVLHKGCRLCINIGDQFARSVYYGRYKIIPIRAEIIKFCETVGFDYMGAIIWQKVTTCNTTGGATIMGSFPYPRNGIIKLDYEFILIFKKLGNPPKVNREIKERSKLTLEEWNEYFYGHWDFPGERQDKHLAMFPEELPKRLIKMFSFVGDTVLDPFLGSGTTCLAAKKLGRNSIGYEIKEDFIPIIKEKLNIKKQQKDSEIIFQKKKTIDYKKEISKLPYIFKDLVRFDKKIDPKKLKFGSKIDDSDYQREPYYSVKEIISPEIVILNNNLRVRLIGVKGDKKLNGKAKEFLLNKLRGQKVFIKFDTVKYDDDNNLLCYLYLKNKTFINAHLIKNKLADVDSSINFKYKDKFLAIQKQMEGEVLSEDKTYKRIFWDFERMEKDLGI